MCVCVDEEDELEDVITATTESVQYDHPNHTVTVTTISDLDLSAGRMLDPPGEEQSEEKTTALPKVSGNPLLSKKYSIIHYIIISNTDQCRLYLSIRRVR